MTAIDLKALEEAFAPITEIGKQEVSFDVGPTSITIRHLTDEEEVHVFKLAQVAITDGTPDNATLQDMLFRLRVSVLARAIVQIGEMDLRSVEEIETGETLRNGVKKKKLKTDVVKGIMSQLPRVMILRLFAKYCELIDRIDIDAEHAIEYEPVDFDEEIKRLEARIEELKDRAEQRATMIGDERGKQIREIVESAKKGTISVEIEEDEEGSLHTRQRASLEPPPVESSQVESPQVESPQVEPPAPKPERRMPPPVRMPPPARREEAITGGTPPLGQISGPSGGSPEMDDSFVDMSDDASLQLAVKREEMQAAARHMQAQKQQALREMSQEPPKPRYEDSRPVPQNPPPHLGAAQAAKEIETPVVDQKPQGELNPNFASKRPRR